MKYLIVALLLLSGCASTQTTLKQETCYVKWSKTEYRTKYIKGLELSRQERSKQDLLIPIWSNGGFRIRKDDSVIFDISDVLGDELKTAVLHKYFELDQEQEGEIKKALWGAGLKLDLRKFEEMSKDYEEVNCEKYFESQYL